jgi:hypothetical protein
MFRFTALLAALAITGCGGSGGGADAASRLAHAAIISGSFGGFESATFPDGSTLVIGEFNGTMTIGEDEANETTISSPTVWSLFLARYGPLGAFEWVRTVEGIGANGVACIVLSDGSSIVTADISGVVVFGAGEPNETTLDTGGDSGSFIARYAADGALIWAKHITAETDGIAGLGDAFVICGEFRGTAVFAIGEVDETSITSAGGSDHYIALYSAGGKLDWVRHAAGTGNGRASSVAAFPNGDSVVTGYFQEACVFGSGEPNETTLTTPSNGPGSFPVNPYVARYHVSGTLAWARKVESSEHVSAFAATALADGSSAISGRLVGFPTVFGPGEPNETTLSGPGLFVARYGPLGDLLWAKSVESPQEFDQQGDLAALSDGSVLVTGTFRTEARAGFGEPNETLLVAEEGAFLARYRSDGSLAWAGREAEASYTWGRSVAVAADDTFVWLGGFEQSAGLALEDVVFPPGAEDGIFVARYRE